MSNKHRNLSLIGGLAGLLSHMLRRGPLLLLAAFFLSAEGPHLRVNYTYQGSHARPLYISCTYLGSRGFRRGYRPGCPVVIWMDARKYKP